MTERADIVVLGAGIVGVSTAQHLLMRGRDVLLVDRREPGEETSYGNAGVVEREGLVPVLFPRGFARTLPFALNRTVAAHYRARDLPKFAAWLAGLRANSMPDRVDRYAAASNALSREAAAEHHALAGPAGAGIVRLAARVARPGAPRPIQRGDRPRHFRPRNGARGEPRP